MKNNFVYEILPDGFIILLIGLIMVLVIFYAFNREEKKLLYSAAGLLLYTIDSICIFSPYKFLGIGLITTVLWAYIPVFGILLILLTQSLYSIYQRIFNLVMIPLLSLSAFIILLNINTVSDYYPGKIIGIFVFTLLIIFIPVLIFNLHSMKRDSFLFAIVIALNGFMFFVGATEIFSALFGGHFRFLVLTYTTPLVILFFVIYYAQNLMKKTMELEALYKRLKVEIKNDQDISVSQVTGKKLQIVKNFIMENYLSDISREGLASAVGMNPNYMSSQFKTYAGMKISEYIHYLRIQDALKKLDAGDERIIDIALSTGFESLSTFNRAFKSITGKTPSEYKNSLSISLPE